MDPIEQMRGKKVKMAGAFYLKHFSEYFMHVSPNQTKEGKTDLMGELFVNNELKDMNDNAEKTGHKIRVLMTDSSVGVKGRMGEFTIDYYKGIVNRHEEIFRLGVVRNIFERPNNRTYVLPHWPTPEEQCKWTSQEDCLLGIKQNEDAQKEIVRRIRQKDIDVHNSGAEDEPVLAQPEREED